jgi:cytochrome b6-f complex iron-sulfur subunit
MFSLTKTLAGAVGGAVVAAVLWVFGRLAGTSNSAAKLVSRRTFIRNATLGAVLVVVGQLTFGFVRFFWPNRTGAFGGILTIPASDVPPMDGEPFRYTPGKFFLVHNQDGLLAIYWRCTHLGCTVPWNSGEDRFHCPCHGSVFLRNGVRESGPAPTPLNLFPVVVLPNGDVEVDTGEEIGRTEYTPEQAVPYPV